MLSSTLSFSRASSSPSNHVFIIDCLSESDLQTGRRCEEDILDVLNEIDPIYQHNANKIQHIPCKDIHDLVIVFECISRICKNGVRPLILIEGHGDKDKGLQLPSAEFMSWQFFLDQLNAITLNAGGELTVVAAFCYSFSATSLIAQYDRLPFSFYYGYKDKVEACVIEREVKLICKALLRHEALQRHPRLEIETYSEYTHVAPFIAVAYLLAKNPSLLSKNTPSMSFKSILKMSEKALATEGIPLSSVRKIVKTLIRNGIVLREIINNMMHDTERRKILLDELDQKFNG